MKEMVFIAGRNGRGLGSCYVYCEEAKMGRAFSDPEDIYEAVGRLCDSLEKRYGESVVCANIGDMEVRTGEQAALITDDRRDPYAAARKAKAAKAAKGAKKAKGKGGSYSATGQWRDVLADLEEDY